MEQNQVFHNRYRLKRLIGRGAFAEVWLAEDNYTKVEVALKIFVPAHDMGGNGINLMSKEFSAVANLYHDNLLRPLFYDTYEGRPYLVLPYCEKGSCVKLIGCLSEEMAWALLRDVASGLAYLHAQQPTPIIHQDIKPDNILINAKGSFLLSDFGVSSKAMSAYDADGKMEAAAVGNCCYKGPEFFSKDKEPIKASDIYSLGATVYELIVGEAPFGELGGLMQVHGCDVPKLPSQFSKELDYIITSCLDKEPWNRPTAATLKQWADQHFRVLEAETVYHAERDSMEYHKSEEHYRKDNKNKRKAIFAAAAVLAGVILTTLIVRHVSHQDSQRDIVVTTIDEGNDNIRFQREEASPTKNEENPKNVVQDSVQKAKPSVDYGEASYVSESYKKTVELKEKQEKIARAKRNQEKIRQEKKKQMDVLQKLDSKKMEEKNDIIEQRDNRLNEEGFIIINSN